MEEEDKDFFVLVLGVLAAIILVVSWWYVSGGVNTAPVAPLPSTAQPDAPDDASADDDSADDASAEEAAPEPTAEPAEEPEEEFELEPAEPEPEPDPEPEEEEPEEDLSPPVVDTVFDIAAGRSDLTVLTNLLRNEGLDQVLTGGGPFTVFAPSNDGVNTAAGSETTAAILEASPSEVLSYHVVQGEFEAQDLLELAQQDGGGELETIQGEPILLTLDGDNLIINGSTVVTPATIDDRANNGIVHTLDNVLIPSVSALNAVVGAEPILFESGSAVIQEQSVPTLDRLIEIMSTNELSVDIEGHTDSTGDAIVNQNLSQSRARSVLNYLVANGIEDSRLAAVGFGPDRPVADNDTEEGRALNRRIEFRLNN